MADNSTGLAVKTLTTEFVRGKLIDTGGTNEAAVSAAGRLSVDASGVAVPVTDNSGSLTADLLGQYVGDAAATATPNTLMISGLANAAAPSDVSANNDAVAMWMLRNGSPVVNLASAGTLITIGQKAMASSLPVVIASDQSALALAAQYVGDAAATATPTGLMAVGLANAAAPTDVSANNDAVAMWMLRNGSPVVNIAANGTLLTNIGQTIATAQHVRISDGTTLATVRDLAANDALNVAIVDGSGNQITSFGSGTQYVGDAAATSTPTGTMSMGLANAAAPSDVSANNDAVAMWMLRNGSPVVNLASAGTLITIGSKTSANSLPVVIASDQGSVAVTPAANSSINVNQIVGSAPGATNPLPVRLTDGAAFYTLKPTSAFFSTQTSAALGAGANVTLTHYVTSGKTGQLWGADVTSTVPIKIEIGTILTGSFTARVVAFALAGQLLQWRAPDDTFITRASSDATTGFGVRITNKDASVAADVYSTGYWDEV